MQADSLPLNHQVTTLVSMTFFLFTNHLLETIYTHKLLTFISHYLSALG